jgi:hypothetical protein
MTEQATATGRAGGLGLAFEFTIAAELAPPLAVGPGPYGTRTVFEVVGGRVAGERLNGAILTGGADWLLAGPDGFGRLDVRVQLQTDDGAAIYVSYFGLLELNAKVAAFLERGEGTEFSDQYFRTAPRMETGDERYAWVQQSLFVAAGRLVPGGVEYDVARVL